MHATQSRPSRSAPLSRQGDPRSKPFRLHGRVHVWIALFETVAERWRVAFVAWRRWREDRVAYAELDAATLRDLGTARCEVESWSAEADGQVERTRRRVATRSTALDTRMPLPEA